MTEQTQTQTYEPTDAEREMLVALMGPMILQKLRRMSPKTLDEIAGIANEGGKDHPLHAPLLAFTNAAAQAVSADAEAFFQEMNLAAAFRKFKAN